MDCKGEAIPLVKETNAVTIKMPLVLALLSACTGFTQGDESNPLRTDLYGDPLPLGAVMRFGTIRLRHAKSDVAFTKDGKQLVSFGRNGEVRVWDAATGALLRRKQLLRDPLREVALSPDGTRAAAWRRTEILVYDTATGEKSGRLKRGFPIDYGYDPRKLLAFSANGKMLGVYGEIWDININKTQELRKDGKLWVIWMLAVAPDGKHAAGVIKHMSELDEPGGQVHLWDVSANRAIGGKEGIALCGISVAFSADGKTLAVGGGGSTVLLLDAATGKKKRVTPEGEGGFIKRLAFSPDGRFLTGSAGYALLLWDLKTENKPRLLPGLVEDARFAFTADGKILACQSNGVGGDIRLWDTASGKRLLGWPGHDRIVRSLALAPDGKHLASVADDGMYLWHAANGKSLRVWEEDKEGDGICLFSSDGKRLIRARAAGELEMVDADTGKRRQRFQVGGADERRSRFHALALSADGKRLTAVCRVAEDAGIFCIWDVNGGKQIRRVPYALEQRTVGLSRGRREPWSFVHAALSPHAEVVTVWRDGRVCLEDAATGILLAKLPKGMGQPDRPWTEYTVRALTFSPDGRFLTAARLQPNEERDGWNDCKGLALLEAATGEEIFRLDIGDFEHAAFTPDSRALIVADKKSLRVWDTLTGQLLRQMPWPRSIINEDGKVEISSLLALPGGRAATGLAEGDLLVWDLAPATWPQPKPAQELDGKKLETLWSDLAGNTGKAYPALHILANAPLPTLAFLNDHLRPAKKDKQIEKLLADLDSDSFAVREAASRELSRLRFHAEPLLRQALESKPSLEKRRRIMAILAEPKQPLADDLRTLRSIAVLERIGTPEARRILEKLAAGATAPETREAQTVLQRLNRRDASANGRTSP